MIERFRLKHICLVTLLLSVLFCTDLSEQYVQIIVIQKDTCKVKLDENDLRNTKLFYCGIDRVHVAKFLEAYRTIHSCPYEFLPKFIEKNWDQSVEIEREVADSIVFGSFNGIFFIGGLRPDIIKNIWRRVCEKYSHDNTCKYSLGVISLSDSIIDELNRLFANQEKLYYLALIEPHEYFTYTRIFTGLYLGMPIGRIIEIDRHHKIAYVKLATGKSVRSGDKLIFYTDKGIVEYKIPKKNYVTYYPEQQDSIIKIYMPDIFSPDVTYSDAVFGIPGKF